MSDTAPTEDDGQEADAAQPAEGEAETQTGEEGGEASQD